jgi:hypothetical protein
VAWEVLMSILSRLKVRQGELFTPPVPQLQLTEEAYQRMLRLLARMLNEHLGRKVHPSAKGESCDE